ncbi:MAG: hypothetical protein HY580_03340 [Nitrospinae bacterium]|nr:hypothetical protein [Nitrospinota bacterium]
MRTLSRFRAPVRAALCLVLVLAVPAFADDAVEFSGEVKKVIAEKNKVSISDPQTKKQFTVTLDGKTKLSGLAKAGDLKKGDKVSGKYVVAPAGAYMASELSRK